jgi:hypothetical protein
MEDPAAFEARKRQCQECPSVRTMTSAHVRNAAVGTPVGRVRLAARRDRETRAGAEAMTG